jgi:short-subunit dehydrogenase
MVSTHPLQFHRKVVLVTGASAGIGAASARAFAVQGATVVLVARTGGPLRRVVDEIGAARGRAVALEADVGDPASSVTLVDRVLHEFGSLDVLVNNAGANHRGPVVERTSDELSNVVHVNLLAPILFTRAALPHMLRRSSGSIVNVASLAGRVAFPNAATYCATKFGLRAFSFALAEELAGSGVRVSVVSPGPVDSGFILSDLDHVPDVVFSQPMSTPEDVAGLILSSALDGARERVPSSASRLTTTLGYLFPAVRQRLMPLMERRGRAAKELYRQRAAAAARSPNASVGL